MLMIPTFIWGGVYTLLKYPSLEYVVMHTSKGGYWFTFVLFEVYLVYVALESLLSQCVVSLSNRSKAGLYLVVSVSVYILYMVLWSRGVLPPLEHRDPLSVSQLLYYVPAFILGVLARMAEHRFFSLQQNAWYVGALLVIVIFSFFYRPVNRIYAIPFMLFIFLLFHRYQHHFSSSVWYARQLIFLGKNSLEIYLLHYFVLLLLDDIAQYVPQTWTAYWLSYEAIAIIIAFIVLAFTLTFLMILRVSPTISKLLFGR